MVVAMTAPSHQRFGRCELVGGAKFAALPGGGASLCAEVERAVSAQAPNASYQVVINVITPSRLSAIPIVNGKSLPAQNVAMMDGKLNADSIKRFAAAVAAAVAKASVP
jgi:hypothetical protein